MPQERTKPRAPSEEPRRVISSTPPGDSSIFNVLIVPYHRELQAYCYRLLGSLQDAEDLTQETMLRAWQHFDSFKGQATLRTWLYSIATNACLDVLRKRSPRTLPAKIAPPTNPINSIAPPPAESIWLEPFPDFWLADGADNPEARYTRRESVSLAFLAVLQSLPPRQRAILLLSDVLDWQASEVAQLLSTSVSAVKSALHRARVTMEQHYHSQKQERLRAQAADKATGELLSRYIKAWEADDIAGLVALLKEDATMSMPPSPSWIVGCDAIAAFLAATAFSSDWQLQWRLFATSANGQPAFIVYRTTPQDVPRAFGVQLLTLAGEAEGRYISDFTSFTQPELVPFFGFPLELPG
jgi:RNA polymerase sigma-70 factor, ECF subfamily